MSGFNIFKLESARAVIDAGEESDRPASEALAEAERCFARALDVARRQNARWWELRAATSLAALRLEQDRADEAHRSANASPKGPTPATYARRRRCPIGLRG